MSIDHRTADHAAESAPPGDLPASTVRPRRPDAAGTALPDRIERARLRARIAALERSLAEHERRHRAVVEGYERLLEECRESQHEERTHSGSNQGVLSRLAARLRIR